MDLISAIKEEIQKLENGWKYIDKVDLPGDVYYYIKVYGLQKYGLKQHQIRDYLSRLALEDKKRYELENNKRIEYNPLLKTIVETTIKNGRGNI